MHSLRRSLVGAACLVVAAAVPVPVVAQNGDDQSAASALPGQVTVVKDLVYAVSRADGTTASLLDLYVGAAGEDAPIVVYVPGQSMARETGAALSQALAERGINVLAIDGFDPSPEDAMADDARLLRAMVETVSCAVRFARGSDYGSETAPLLLTGFSYGGGSASHVALAGEDFERVWRAYESKGGSPSQVDCTASEGSTHVDGLVGIAGTYDIFVGNEGRFAEAFWEEQAPELREMLRGTIGLHPELTVRLLHGDADWLPHETSTTFEAQLADTGHDVDLTQFMGGHMVPLDLTVETIIGLLGS